MCPPSESPLRAHSSWEGGQCAELVLVIDARASLLLDANCEGWQAWGLDPQASAPPIAIDSAMPALQRLRELAAGPADLAEEALTFWTARGAVHLTCRVHARDAALVTVRAPVAAGRSRRRSGAPLRKGRESWGSEPAALPARFALGNRLAHELRTPLSAVIAYAEILKDEHFGPLASARYRGYARDIYEGARHALGVVDSMLSGEATQSLVPALAFADIEPAGVVESCLAVVRPLADRAGLELAGSCVPGLPRIVADELSLKQMLLNLLGNAIKFGRRGDRVTLAVTYDSGGPLRICVADTGPGMGCNADNSLPDSAVGEAVARPALAGGAGLGLGLPLTRALAAANGAVLDIASTPGCGTCVTIAFGKDRLVRV
jgi:two-component system, cell cycle sensor histidine kinase PleC